MNDRMKEQMSEVQGGIDAIGGIAVLPEDTSLFDKEREQHKQEGGEYTPDNTRAADTVEHMKRHGIYREREGVLQEMKTAFDDRVQTMKLYLKMNNQKLAYARRVDDHDEGVLAFLDESLAPIVARLKAIEKKIQGLLAEYDDPLAQAAMKVKGLGPITVAALAVYVDLGKRICSRCMHTPDICTSPARKKGEEKNADSADRRAVVCKDGPHEERYAASTPSSLWAYVGLDKPSRARYEKGTAGGGNKTLRTILWNSANVMVKLGEGPYRDVYDRTKARLEVSEKLVKTRNTAGREVEVAWKDTKKSHRHGAALRAVMKHLLVDYWVVGRAVKGLPTRTIYAEGMLGHEHIVSPRERGWTY